MIAELLLAAACGGGDSDGSVDATGDLTFQDVNEQSPLAQAMGWASSSDQDAVRDEFVAEERERQEVIAQCMRDQGFEYIPLDFSQSAFFGVDEQFGGLEPGTREWTERYGYGYSTTFDQNFGAGPEDEFRDPNQEYIESLSPAETDAYYAALYGSDAFDEFDPTLSDEELAEEEQNFEYVPQGCEGQAWEG